MKPPKTPRKLRPIKVGFSLIPLAVGGVAGMVVSLLVELSKGPSLILMQLGAMAGIALGSLLEGVRFWWRKTRQEKQRKTKP